MYTLIILVAILIVPIPVMIKYMLAGKSAYRGVLEGILSAMIAVSMVFLLFWAITGQTIFHAMETILNQISVSDMNLMQRYEMLGITNVDPAELQTTLDNVKETMMLAVPGSIILCASVFAYINYKIISWILRKSGKRAAMLPPFWAFSLPKSIMLGSILIYLLSYLAAGAGIIDKNIIMYNMQMLFIFIFSVQGLAVVFYYGYLKRTPRLLVWIISVIFIVTWIGQTFLFLLGLSDIALDIRKRFSQTNLK
ncbi:DUF2232 domain-containing protein [Sinanaerobacter chloroacetimidivorans]|jgi:uncharacterized protein YybS (DUF2232 family)|uniref:DUF2232 domain-containing protein n=1 Tax=Sinanaerobacter chloroacetimidivorans TaxID=2818044 RepID=A0A8J7W0V8_9FIRM|nr:DUF2232 domain-containing protein [Sinanaerobacter chloroacetimidivorans]MBR0598341.1 DUF2232 domain-containing protein [Sinanaerobacter chloroacetimidivorans]